MKATTIFEALQQLIETETPTATQKISGELELSEYLVTYIADIVLDEVDVDSDHYSSDGNWTLDTITIEASDEEDNQIKIEFDKLSHEDQELITDDIERQVDELRSNQSLTKR